MGKATVCALARQGFRMVMLCRSRGRGEAALRDVRTQGVDAELALCDLADMADIRRFAAEFRARHDRLDVLVLNAGVITLDRRETKDGLEQTFGVNHIGHFLLTQELLPLMGRCGRIVVVGSGAHKIGKIHFGDINLTRGYNVFRAYGQSKLANLLFARELALRLEDQGITVNCVHPGAVGTNMGVDRDTGFGKAVMALLRPFFLTPEQGAETAVYLATSADVVGATGGYYYRQKPAGSSCASNDPELARRLWALSERIVGGGIA